MNAILILPVVLVLVFFAWRRDRRDDVPAEIREFCRTGAGWRNR